VKSQLTADKNKLSPDKIKKLNSRHLRGALVRSIASLSGWAFALIAFSTGVLKTHHLIGISVSVLYLILINFPALMALKNISSERSYNNFSLLINQLEILGYTSIIYFCGDIEATHLTLIYAALIAYVGVVAPKKQCFIVAGLCAATYVLMFALIQIDIIPHLGLTAELSPPLTNQLVIIFVVIALLYTVAFISATSAGLIKKNKDQLEQQNQKLAVANDKLMHEIQLRIEAVEALRESEDQYRTILESAPDSITILGINDGCYMQVNECFCQLTGYAREKVLGKTPFDLNILTNGDWNHLLEIIKEKGKIDDLDINLKSKDGKPIHTLLSARTIRYSGENCLITVITDITNRKQAERMLRESENRYKTLTNNLNVGVYRNTVGPKGKFIEANPAIVKMFGFQSKDEFLAVDVADLYENPIDRNLFNEKMLAKGFVKNEELNLRKKDGASIKGSVSSVCVKDENGKVKYYDGIIEDISERKQLEGQLQQAQKMEAIGTLAGGIAHDFNNLLMAIQGNASLIHCDLDSDNPHCQSLMNIENAVKSGSMLTKQLLGYARKGKYQVNPISLNQLVEETANTLARTRKDITVHYELSKDLKAILADQGQIEQVLMNLFVNAADAMAAEGDLFLKTFNITHKNIKSSLYTPKPGKYVQLIVTDTGIGMDKKTQGRIFEPFYTTKEMGRGTGLGLASVFGIIKGHGGYIDVESEVGRGTSFKICLPASSQKIVESVTEEPNRIINGNGTILLVDDELLVLETGSKILERLGYTVLEANGGNEAVEIYKENKEKIDMVILDMIMPDMGGGRVFDKIKEMNPEVRVLLSSGYSIDGQATEILRRGCDDFIQKPFSINKLSEKVSEFLT